MKLPVSVQIVVGFLETVEKLLDEQVVRIARQEDRIVELEKEVKAWKYRAEV